MFRAPLWQSERNEFRVPLEEMKSKQMQTLEQFCRCDMSKQYENLHELCFDWWMFPIDDGSKEQFNIGGEADVIELRSNEEWFRGYREAVQLVARAWGWDVDQAKRIEPQEADMGWSHWDIRLAKIIRSLYLFEQADYMGSMQAFARDLQENEKNGEGFFYGDRCLDELLHFSLPRDQYPQPDPMPVPSTPDLQDAVFGTAWAKQSCTMFLATGTGLSGLKDVSSADAMEHVLEAVLDVVCGRGVATHDLPWLVAVCRALPDPQAAVAHARAMLTPGSPFMESWSGDLPQGHLAQLQGAFATV